MRKIHLLFICILIVFIFPSCINIAKSNKGTPQIEINNKNSYANYGELAMYDKGKIYFEYSEKIYQLDTSDNALICFSKGKISGSLFCIDNNLLYYKNVKNKGACLFSSDIDGGSIKKILDFKFNLNKKYIYLVENDIPYFALGELKYYKNNGLYAIDPDEKTTLYTSNDFSLYKDENDLYIKDVSENISGMYDIDNNYFFPYEGLYPTILSYNNNLDLAYIYVNGHLCCYRNGSIKYLADISENSNLSTFFEDKNNFYLVFQNKPDGLFRIDKENGDVESIYTASGDEHILSVNSEYFITYDAGELSKRDLKDGARRSSVSLLNADANSGELECSGNYLFAKIKGILHIVNLNTMKELSIDS